MRKRHRVKDKDIKDFLSRVQLLLDYFFESNGLDDRLHLYAVKGDRYARIEASDHPRDAVIQHSKHKAADNLYNDLHCWGFIDLWNGDCLRAWSYRTANHKTPRGNLFDSEGGMGYVDWFGFKEVWNGYGLSQGARVAPSLNAPEKPYKTPLELRKERFHLVLNCFQLEEFIFQLNEKFNPHGSHVFARAKNNNLEWIKIYECNDSGMSVLCGIRVSTGTIHKPRDWTHCFEKVAGSLFNEGYGVHLFEF